MTLKPGLRAMKALGCEATSARVTLHLREDTPLDPAKVMDRVAEPRSQWKLSPDMKLTRRFDAAGGDAVDRVEELLRELEQLKKDS
jgi:transcription-repair coupling factor (superfamily II helicase)